LKRGAVKDRLEHRVKILKSGEILGRDKKVGAAYITKTKEGQLDWLHLA